jgi:hypothetical protein
MNRSYYLHEAARLRRLIAEATTARARQHLEQQAKENEQLATKERRVRRSIADDFRRAA